jgi:hypothetical protein
MKRIQLKCVTCNKVFDKQKKEYDRQIKKGNVRFFCSLSCSSKLIKRKHYSIIKKCKFCNADFTSSTSKKSKSCCSLKCAKRYSQSHVDVEKISQSVKRYYELNPRKNHIKKCICEVCNSQFDSLVYRKTCSEVCYIKLITKNSRNNPNCGGETNYKRYIYKGIYMDSSWEVKLAEWLDENKIKWIRDRKINFKWTDDNGNTRRYYPDFYLIDYNVYCDPKNKYLQGKDKVKIERAQVENNITVFWGFLEDIKKNLMGNGSA